MTTNTNPAHEEITERDFDESVTLDDPRPFIGWLPSPRQIREWGKILQAENYESRREAISPIVKDPFLGMTDVGRSFKSK